MGTAYLYKSELFAQRFSSLFNLRDLKSTHFNEACVQIVSDKMVNSFQL